MRILLIATNRYDRLVNRMNARPIPIGLAYIAGYLDHSRHTVKLVDLMFSEDYLADTEAAVREFQPELIGLSVRNLDNSSFVNPEWELPSTRQVIERIRTVGGVPIVCGGPAFSLFPQECFTYLQPDLGVAGDAGETFAQLADCLENGESYRHLPGMVYSDGNGIVVCGGLAYSSFTCPPRLDELDMARYERAGFGIGIVTKLDDSFSHSVEPRHTGDGAPWRVVRPIEDVVAEVTEMKERYGLRKVFFIDSGFNVPQTHARSLCLSLIEADLKVHWNTYIAPLPQTCEEDLLMLMKRAGCALVIMKSVTAEQGAQDLESQLAPLREVCRLSEKAGLHYTISQSFGEPGDTRETVEAKLSFLREIRPALANLRVGQRVSPGTEAARLALQDGTISDESELIKPVFYVEPSVKDWIVEHLQAEAASNPRWNVL